MEAVLLHGRFISFMCSVVRHNHMLNICAEHIFICKMSQNSVPISLQFYFFLFERTASEFGNETDPDEQWTSGRI